MIAPVPSWDQYFIALLPLIASRSKDPHTHVGCVIVGPDNHIRSTGYNSFPRGINDSVPERLERPEKYFWMEHAERNAIYAAIRNGNSLDGCCMYVSLAPCMDCARAVVSVGISQVVYDAGCQAAWETPRYASDLERTVQLFKEAGVVLRSVEPL